MNGGELTKQSSSCWLTTQGGQGGSCVIVEHAVDEPAQVVRIHVTAQPLLELRSPPEVHRNCDALALHLMPPALGYEERIPCLQPQAIIVSNVSWCPNTAHQLTSLR